LIRKIQGLDDATARRAPTASSLSLLGLVKHATIWERRWLEVIVGGHESGEDWPIITGRHQSTFMVGEDDTVNEWVSRYRGQIELSRAVAESMDLDRSCARSDLIECNVRYVMFHMIEETARHAGHADIIRETLDGSCGI
jgi:uncharacterized damage-inducible protein DinB